MSRGAETGAREQGPAGICRRDAPDRLANRLHVTEAYFHELAAALDQLIAGGETYTAALAAETSEFVRLNHGQVRQPGTVAQGYLDVDLIDGRRHATHRVALSGQSAHDREVLRCAVARLREVLPDVAEDPHLLLPAEVRSTRSVTGGVLPPAAAIVETVLDAAAGLDLVGLYAGGPVARGFANALGQRNWHQATSFNFDWSLYHRADKAVKARLSGFEWDTDAFSAKMHDAQAQLDHIALPARALPAGNYRTYLTPAALEEIAGMLCWGGFSARALATRQSSLSRMLGTDDARYLDPRVTMSEAIDSGIAPEFQSAGFIRPGNVPLIAEGRLIGALRSPRTAREFGGETNGANPDEAPEALEIAGGALPMADALAALDTGLYVGNLWYLNYSDQPACRMTGMTRFATFWVERGRIKAPVDVLRFDDTLYRMLGSNLEALTTETELRLESSTYRQRALASMRLPGALLREMTFTL